MSENLNINEIIKLVKDSNKEFESDIYLPSQNKEIHIKSMNASHLKSIIKTAVSETFHDLAFNQTVFIILREILDQSCPISSITNLDKIVILLQLREKNVRPTLKVSLKNDDETKTIEHEINISDIIKKVKESKFKFKDETVQEGSYEITLSYPTIDQEYNFHRYLEQTKIKKIDENNKEELKNIFGPIFIQELGIYIKTIKIKESVIDMNKLVVADRISVVENLPTSALIKIIESIDSYFGKQINEILKIEKEIDNEKYTGDIPVNATLFT
jgi:hypothetical protein